MFFMALCLILISIRISLNYEREVLGFVAIKTEYERFIENERMGN